MEDLHAVEEMVMHVIVDSAGVPYITLLSLRDWDLGCSLKADPKNGH